MSERISKYRLPALKFLAIFVFLGIAGLLVFGYRITREWQRSVAARIAHQNEESADLIKKAVQRDMRGAQTRVLANRDWDAPSPGGDAREMTEQVATTFARFPYPESFFTWRGTQHPMVFFSRVTRLPGWMSPQNPVSNSPIAVAVDPSVAGPLQKRILASGAAQLRYGAFNTEVGGVPYQVIFRINYTNSLRERMESAIGFTVNLDWVRKGYFTEILSEVGPSASGGLTQDVTLVDEYNHVLVGPNDHSAPMAERRFPLLFMDSSMAFSDTALESSPDFEPAQWHIRVSASRDPILLSAGRRVDITLLATMFAVMLCGISLMLAYKAVLTNARLAEMRSRFVSSVTHELKTPLANIHALAATLARQSPPIPSGRYHEYPNLLIAETGHLRRLVENLLAYARITDVSEVYSFEPMAAAELVDEAVRAFQLQLSENSIKVQLETSPDLPFVRVDQRAMLLAINNLIDNAMRHARKNGGIRITTMCKDSVVSVEVQDNGCGISTERLAALRASIASRNFAPSDSGGLGLAIASKVVADHRGTLTVDSVSGMGTRCIIGLPAC